MARKHVKSRPGLFGMVYYYDENGNPIGKSRPGLVEGTRVYTDQNGEYIGKSRPGFLSKEVFTDADHNHITAYDGICGEIHFKNGAFIGYSRPGLFGSSYTSLEIEDDDFYEDELDIMEEDSTEEMRYEKFENEDYESYTPQVDTYTVVKKLQSFVLLIVICAVVACVYVIIKL